MKKIVVYLVVISFCCIAEMAAACCYTESLYFVQNVEEGDRLNVREEPYPLAPVVAALNSGQKYFALTTYTDENEEMYRHNLCVTVDYFTVGGKKIVSRWCHIQKPSGWVNMHYLGNCNVEVNDEGEIVQSECSGIAAGKKITDYLSTDKTTTTLLNNAAKKLLGPWLLDGQDWGFTLYSDGTASSINAATLIYHNWRIKSDRLCLTIRSIGNHTESVDEECRKYRIAGEKGRAELIIGKGTSQEIYRRP